MNAVVLAVGDELISGKTVDANSAYLAARLAERGIEPVAHIAVGDDVARIADAFRRAAEVGEVVCCSGGLGPTPDDVTRDGLARAMGRPLHVDATCLERIEAFFRARGRTMVPTNRVQAMIPDGAEPMNNELGTAPGITGKVGEAAVFCLPGVPHEMRDMFEQCVAPRLPRGSGATVTRVLHAFGVGESDLAARISDLLQRGAQPLVGITVSAGVISLRIIGRGKTASEAAQQADAAAAVVRQRLGTLVFAADEPGVAALAAAVLQELREAHETLATAESCTGGMLGEVITAVAGASEIYRGGVVAYADDVKRQSLGVPDGLLSRHGAVSAPVAAAMADGARERFGTDWALGITGIAGPGGGTDDKPVGLVHVALTGPAGSASERHVFPGTREVVRLRSALTALNMLRLKLGASRET
ncbi:MAG: competence/damage-inducible protein A [Phycisphaerae bacterium]|nr:competence/damage-inducible protein A [Phycisphaerae bacterium]